MMFINIIQHISEGIELISALIICIATIRLIIVFFIHQVSHNQSFNSLRLNYGHSISISLELLLAADVLETAISPGWTEIGQLAAIAIIRTTLNYFLEKELKKENAM